MGNPSTESKAESPEPHRPVLIGLVGGIGAGKSAAAASFESLGCIVIDSDSRAKAQLDNPEVRKQLVQWWGPEILDEAGRVDRRALAEIVFASDTERHRLESLAYPTLAAERARTIREAALAGAPAVILDAPMLIEAGLDKECDAVVFVEAPREVRLRRVLESRGWDESEVDRRENAQLGLDKKRRRAHDVLVNTGSTDELHAQVVRVLREIVARDSRRSIQS